MSYLKFEEVLPLLNEGKKARMVDWGDKMYSHIQKITPIGYKEKIEGHVNPQPFIAIFYKNGGFLPHPYSFPSYDVTGGQWEIIEADENRAETKRIKTRTEGKELLISCYQVVKRKGVDTNWDDLEKKINKHLESHTEQGSLT